MRRGDATPITVIRVIPGAVAAVFDFLADLDNHLLFHDRYIRIVHLDGEPGARNGGRLRLRGPFGLRRIARTEVLHREPPHMMTGLARIGSRTVAHIRWALHPHTPNETRVELTTTITSTGVVDRAMLGLGGRLWLRRRIAGTLARIQPHPARDTGT
jgi:hypothetical protein